MTKCVEIRPGIGFASEDAEKIGRRFSIEKHKLEEGWGGKSGGLATGFLWVSIVGTLNEVTKTSAESIKSPHHQRIALA